MKKCPNNCFLNISKLTAHRDTVTLQWVTAAHISKMEGKVATAAAADSVHNPPKEARMRGLPE